MKTSIFNHKLLLSLLAILLLGFSAGLAQSISVYPTVAYRGQVNTFLVTGSNVNFNSVSSCYLYDQGPYAYYDILPAVSGQTMTAMINLPQSASLGLYDFGFIWWIGGGMSLQSHVSVLDPPSSAGTISGTVRRSSGCAGGVPLPNRLILINPGGFLTMSGPNGQYSTYVPAGTTYSVQVLPTALDTMACPTGPYSANVSTVGQNVGNLNFGMNPLNVADVEVQIAPAIHRPGFTITNWVTVKNNGSAAATGVEVKVHVPNWLGYTSNTGGGTFLNDTITWTIPTLAGHATTNFQFVVVPPINSLGWPYVYTAVATSTTADILPDNNSTSTSGVVQGSYDPNDKQVWVRDSVVADGPINPTDSILHYLIRFQNTGTDTAFNIRINDTIDPNLDISTLQITQSSHAYQLELLNNNEINFHFPNILLLDSNANEPLSHGFIGYQIKRNPGLALGTEIGNEANIYFDFNLPVLTNKVVSKICPPVSVDFSSTSNLTTVALTNLTTGSPGTFLWDFGDGNTSTANSPTHTYASGGNYAVCLNFSDTCGTRSLCKLVAINCTAPQASYQSVTNQLAVNFTDQSSSSAFSWLWDFGDGNTSTLQNPAHTYAAPGNYLVCLSAMDSCNTTTFCDTVSISCSAPTPGFGWSQSQLQATFSDQSSGTGSLTYSWDFGDGNASTLQNPVHNYALPGTYQVCLTTTDVCGAQTFCDSITVVCLPPSAAYSFQPNGTNVQFVDQGSSDIVSWAWDFGDGNGSTSPSPLHGYANSGSYTACLVVTNVCGEMDTTCQALTVLGVTSGLFRQFDLYPNPNDGRFILRADFGEAGQLRAQVRDLAGRLLYDGDWGAVQGQFKKDMEVNLPAGSYFLQLHLNGRQINRMFLIR